MTPYHPDLGDPEAAAINRHMERPRMAPCDCNREMGDRCGGCAPTSIVPPKVGDRWGDLTPEQRAMVPVGSELVWTHHVSTKVANNRWRDDADPKWPYSDGSDSMNPNNVITRLGPAPTATPEPDRSGWPVLVRSTFYDKQPCFRHPERCGTVVWGSGDEWYSCTNSDVGARFGSALAAADAIQARLPEDVAPVTTPDPRDAEIADLRSQVEAADRTFADIAERAAVLGMPAGLHVGTWWSAQLTEARERAREMEARANEAAAEIDMLREAVPRELAALRTVVREAMEACERAGVHEGLTPAERIDVLVCQRNLADHALADARERLGRARERWEKNDAEIAQLRGAVLDADERMLRAVDGVVTTGARLRDALKEIAGISDTDPTTHADEVIIERANERARRAEAELDKLREHLAARTKDRDSLEAAWDAARTDAARLRAAIADALDITGQVPPDDELVRRLRGLDGGQDLAVVRKVIGTCTTTIRKVVCEEKDAVSIAVDGLCEVIETTVGVEHG